MGREKKKRSTHRTCSIKKGVFKNFTKFTGKYMCWSLFLIKLQVCSVEIPKQVISFEFCEIKTLKKPSKAYSKHCQRSKMELFVKIVNGYFWNGFLISVWFSFYCGWSTNWWWTFWKMVVSVWITAATWGVLREKGVLKNVTGKHLCWSLFLLKLKALQPVVLLKWDFNRNVLLWNFRNF